MNLQDTICALSTPHGQGALAVVRISGPGVRELASALRPDKPDWPPRKALRIRYHDLAGRLLDDGLATRFAQPHSFTGEAMLELSLHGNPLIVQQVLDDLVARGCRLAEPGEFTRRAFWHGKIDLSQAEAVADIISARNLGALQAAQQHLRGDLGQKVASLVDELLQAMAQIEAYIDFPEEDLPPEDQAGPLATLASLSRQLRELSATRDARDLLCEGIPTVILGAPNAGKSSLLNALLGQDRAIVSAIPGTTRDFITEKINLGSHTLRLYDTAGLHQAADALEQAGIDRALSQIEAAQLLLLVVDRSDAPPALPEPVVDLLASRASLLILNKSDLPENPQTLQFLPQLPRIQLCLTESPALDPLRSEIQHLVAARHILPEADQLMVNARHAEALDTARQTIDAARNLAATEHPMELVAEELRQAIDHLGEVVGRIDNEAMLDRLFASFCIGK